MVRTAGIIWLVFGSAILIQVILGLTRLFAFAVNLDWFLGMRFSAVVEGLVQGVIGGFFLYEGIESCRGKIPSMIGIAVASFLFAMLYVGIAFFQTEGRQWYELARILIIVAGLLAAGVLAFLGQTQYDLWYKAQARQRDKSRPEPK
jgi:hypothetical protein